MSKLKKDKLILLEKLVQSGSDGEISTEQRDLFVNLVKETSPKSPKMRKKSANASDRQSRQRVKIVRTNSHELKDKNHGNVKILLPQTENRSRSRSASSNSRSNSSSSFWSAGSKDRTRMRRTSSRSSSSSSGSSYSRSRSGSSSSSTSRSRSRSSSMEYSRNKVRDRSKSPKMPKSRSKEARSGSLSSTQSTPSKPIVTRRVKVSRDTASDSGRNDKGKRKRLLKRGEIKKSRSFDINPDIFIEERLKQKYKELRNLLSNQFAGSQVQMTQHQFQQMQDLRVQYVNASHGLPPSGVLVPRSLPASMRVKRGAPQGISSRRTRSKDTLASTSDLGEDQTYVSVQRVLNTSAARDGKVIVERHPVSIKKKKKTKQNSDSNSKLNSTFDSTSDHTGSRTLSPRSRMNVPELHHLKDSNNPDLLKWLKQKDKEHRRKEKEERKKRREEREKLVLEANEKFEQRMESQKFVEKWRVEKEKEYRKTMKEKRKEEKVLALQQKIKMELSLPGKSMTVRPQTAPPEWKRKTETKPIKTDKENNVKKVNNVRKAQTVQDQLGTSSEHLKFDLDDQKSHDPLPPTSKFIYKRPVAGKIKLNMRNRPMSAQPKLQTSNKEQSEDLHWQTATEEHSRNTRMSYDDWVNTKRKQDQDKRKQEKFRQKEELSKSDPEMDKLVPDIAKKRIHTMMNERKSIDTGIKRYDKSVNQSFGGGSYDGSKSPKRTHSYKLGDDRPGTAKDKTVESLKVGGKSYQRPGTAPSGGKRVPIPMRSPYSPVPAHPPPAHVEEIMNSEDQSNPFKLPFSAEEGVPKHVAAMQKKLFSEETWQKDDRPEPQGCDHDSSLAVVPCTSAITMVTEDIKYDNITAMEKSDNVNIDKKKDYKEDEKKESDTQNLNGDPEIINVNVQQKKHDKIETKGEKNVINEESRENDKNYVENDEKLNGDLANENSDTKLENGQKGYDEVDNKNADQNCNGEVEADGNVENPLNQSSNLSKHVSFCEEPEVFVNHDNPDWSTDTDTPDEDNSRYTTKEDLSTLIDSCGELLNREYGQQKEESDKTFMTESLDDDF